MRYETKKRSIAATPLLHGAIGFDLTQKVCEKIRKFDHFLKES
jgi:hypothetical protein